MRAVVKTIANIFLVAEMSRLAFRNRDEETIPMRSVFAIEAFVLIFATLATTVALIARLPWRWLRLTCWFILACALLLIWAASPFGQPDYGTRIERLNTAYPTLMCIAWTSLAALTVGVTLVPLIGFWRTGEKKFPNGRFWPLGRLSLAIAVALFLVTLSIYVRDQYVQNWIANARLVNQDCVAMLSPRPVDPDEDAAPVYFRFVKADGGVLVYSVGRNGIDEKGFGDITDPWSPDITLRIGSAYRKWRSDMEKKRAAQSSAPSGLRRASFR